jgi:hypothetical protein
MDLGSARAARHRALTAVLVAAASVCVAVALGLSCVEGLGAHRLSGRLLGAAGLLAIAATFVLAIREAHHRDPPPPDDARWLRR